VYNEMKIQEFLKYDFRKPNFDRVSDRLGEYSSILRTNISIEDLQRMADENALDESQSRQRKLSDITSDPDQAQLGDDYNS
jgi:hypothetical protein